jgi:ribosomal-protein-alanine N-acetyltransferase
VSEIRVAPADPTLHDLLAGLQAACSEEVWGGDFVGRLLATPGAFALLATAASSGSPEPIGYAIARVGGGEAEVLSIGVLAAARRNGAGRALMIAVAEQAKLLGAASLFLEVALDNAPALSLYRGLGFRLVGQRPGYYRRSGVAVDAQILRLHLSGLADQV